MISVIIPTFNEEHQIRQTIQRLWQNDLKGLIQEIIVADGGSADATIAIAESEGIKVILTPKGRAKQMNIGATAAKNELLYFLHADSLPPLNYSSSILEACRKGAVSGCFRLQFDYDHWFLKANSWFTRFNINAVRFGDQSLFVSKEIFLKAGGFREDLLMMEDQEIIPRIKKLGQFIVMKDVIVTSARKYVDNGIYRMQGIFYLIWALYYLGFSQTYLLNLHRKLISQHKL